MKWTKEEEQFLTDNYAEHGPVYCAEKLNRIVNSVYKKACKLNLTKSLIKCSWSAQEEQFLNNNYAEHGPAYCAKALNRTVKSVNVKVSRLNLKKSSIWAKKEEQFLVDNYAEYGPTYCAEKLNRSYNATHLKASKLNLQANTKYDSNIVYVVYFPGHFLYKVGITNNVERRIKEFGQSCVILKTEKCETPQEAAKLERHLLKSVTLINTGYLNSGNTETFMQPSKEIELFLK